jgi:hypothetical protein
VRSSGQEFLWIVTLLVGFLLFTLGETEWLRRHTKATTSRLLLVTFTSNILALVLFQLLSFVIFLIGVIAFGARDTPALWALIFFGGIVAVTAPPLALIKLLLINVAKVEGLVRAWSYALVTAALFQLATMGLFLVLALFV